MILDPEHDMLRGVGHLILYRYFHIYLTLKLCAKGTICLLLNQVVDK